jgi:hypothetical protein
MSQPFYVLHLDISSRSARHLRLLLCMEQNSPGALNFIQPSGDGSHFNFFCISSSWPARCLNLLLPMDIVALLESQYNKTIELNIWIASAPCLRAFLMCAIALVAVVHIYQHQQHQQPIPALTHFFSCSLCLLIKQQELLSYITI